MQYLGAISKNNTKISVRLQGKAFNITVIYVPTTAEEALVDTFYEDLQDLLELTLKKKNVLFIIGDWNAQLGSQQIYRLTGELGLGMQNETGQQITVLSREHAGHTNTHFQQ